MSPYRECELADDGGVSGRVGPGVGGDGEHGDAGEHGDGQCAHDDERGRRILALGLLEGWDAVADRLDAGQCGTPGSEGAKAQQEGEDATDVCGLLQLQPGARCLRQAPVEGLVCTAGKEQERQDDEGVGGERERGTGFPHAA